MRRGLDELNLDPLGILHFEVLASIARFCNRGRHRNTMSLQIFPQALGAGRVESCVIEAIDRKGTRRQRQNFNKLDWAEVISDAGGILRIRSFYAAEIMNVKVLGLRGIGRVDAQVRDAGDLWPLLRDGADWTE